MKLPESLFVLVNPLIRSVLRSPLHGLLSGNLMLIRFKGRISGREFVTPVRYIRNGKTIQCFTGRSNQWWRNMRDGSDVVLRLAGKESRYRMTAISSDPERIVQSLRRLLNEFPQDAPYYDIRMQSDRTPELETLNKAGFNTVLIEAVAIN